MFNRPCAANGIAETCTRPRESRPSIEDIFTKPGVKSCAGRGMESRSLQGQHVTEERRACIAPRSCRHHHRKSLLSYPEHSVQAEDPGCCKGCRLEDLRLGTESNVVFFNIDSTGLGRGLVRLVSRENARKCSSDLYKIRKLSASKKYPDL